MLDLFWDPVIDTEWTNDDNNNNDDDKNNNSNIHRVLQKKYPYLSKNYKADWKSGIFKVKWME